MNSAASDFNIDNYQVCMVKLKSFSPLHPGRERWKRVIKRSWRFIPGSTFYGALYKSYTNFKGEEWNKEFSTSNISDNPLLEAIQQKKIRFSPLVMVFPENENRKKIVAIDYNRYARYALEGPFYRQEKERPGYWVTPHLAVEQRSQTSVDSSLRALVRHSPFKEYAGFIVFKPDSESLIKELRKAVRLLPFYPFGGHGKFSSVEAVIEAPIPAKDFLDNLPDSVNSLYLLTPAVININTINEDNLNQLLKSKILKMKSCFNSYKVWRHGTYFESMEDGSLKIIIEDGESAPVKAVPEGSCFKPDDNNMKDFERMFLLGAGDPAWTYLGWGQVIKV